MDRGCAGIEPFSDRLSEPADRVYEQFLRLFTADQARLLAYILSLVHDRDEAQEVFQETSLVLWRSFPTFRPGSEFLPWAIGIARHQVLKRFRTRRRDRHIFSEELLTMLAADAVSLAAEIGPRQRALVECMKGLSEGQRQLVDWFYGQGLAAGQIAERRGRSVHAVYKGLKVLRRNLLKCIERRLVEGA